MGVWIIQAEVPAELVGLAIAAVLFSGMVGLLWLQARSLARWDRE
jgi:hypothetical protein